MRNWGFGVAIVVVVLGFGTVASADIVELKTGQKVEGVLKQVNSAAVTVEVGGQLVSLKREQVRAIYLGPVGGIPRGDDPKTPTPAVSQVGCSMTGNVFWEFNTNIGTKADAGARVFLFRQFEPRVLLDPVLETQETNRAKGVHPTEVNLQGRYEIANIAPGYYDVLFVSKQANRNILVKIPFSSAEAEGKARNSADVFDRLEYANFNVFKESILKYHFAEKDYGTAVSALLRTGKYEVDRITCKSGETIEKSVNFGNTYFR